MIEYPCTQGTQEWIDARIGIPTASGFANIMTPKTFKPTSGERRAKYIYKLVAEWLLKSPVDDYLSQFMERGSALEEQGVKAFEFTYGIKTRECGFVYRDESRMVGCSPDRLFVGSPGGLELKTPAAHNHIGYLLDGFESDYICQVQGGLWVCGFDKWFLTSFNPVFPDATIETGRDEKWMAAFVPIFEGFMADLLKARDRVLELGCVVQDIGEVVRDTRPSGAPVGGCEDSGAPMAETPATATPQPESGDPEPMPKPTAGGMSEKTMRENIKNWSLEMAGGDVDLAPEFLRDWSKGLSDLAPDGFIAVAAIPKRYLKAIHTEAGTAIAEFRTPPQGEMP